MLLMGTKRMLGRVDLGFAEQQAQAQAKTHKAHKQLHTPEGSSCLGLCDSSAASQPANHPPDVTQVSLGIHSPFCAQPHGHDARWFITFKLSLKERLANRQIVSVNQGNSS